MTLDATPSSASSDDEDSSSNIINLGQRRKSALNKNTLPEPNSFWDKRKNTVSLMLAERTLQGIAPALVMTKFMQREFLRPVVMHKNECLLWAAFPLNYTNAPLSLGLNFVRDTCHVEIGCSAQVYIHPVPVDNPWAVLYHLETVSFAEIKTVLGESAANHFYAFMRAFRQTLNELAKETPFYAEVKNRCLLPPELLKAQGVKHTIAQRG